MAVLRTAMVMTASLSAPVGLVVLAPMVLEGPLRTDGPASRVTEQHEIRKLSQLGWAGRKLFLRNCVDCHGDDARGSQRGASLVSEAYHRENFGKRAFHAAVRPGASGQVTTLDVSHSFPKLSFNQVEQLERYIRELQDPTSFK